MATYTDITINQDTGIGSGKIDGILFSSVNLAEGSFPVSQPKVAPVNSIFDPSGNQTNKALIINAVDIDWNGAKPDIGETSDGITTTGELLTLIKNYADTTVKNSLIGSSTDESTANTIWGAKNYANTTVKNSLLGATGDQWSTKQTLYGVKDYADGVKTASYNKAEIEASNVRGHDGDLWPDRKTVYGVAKYVDTTAKDTLIGKSTDASTADTIWGAKNYAQEQAIQAYHDARNDAKEYVDTTAKDNLIGKSTDAPTADTIWGAKNYANTTVKNSLLGASGDTWPTKQTLYGVVKYSDTKIAELQTRVEALEKAFSTLAQNVGALVTITNGDQT